MRTIDDFNIPHLSKAELNDREMNTLKGGGSAFDLIMAAWYATPQGSYTNWERTNEDDNSQWQSSVYDFIINNGYLEICNQIGWATVWEQCNTWMGFYVLF